jgi:hypothetical protein
VAAGFLFRLETLSTQNALLILGILVTLCASMALLVRFSSSVEAEEQQALAEALTLKRTPPIVVTQ